MKPSNLVIAAVLLLGSLLSAAPAAAAETCGNGVDDDSDGYADEGCGFSNSVMGVCPSPMSCRETGDIDAVTGAFVYSLPADINPKVPYGMPLEFRRTYLSMYSPPATNYRTAMGNRFVHNWMSWLDKSGTSVIVHLPTGQDVKFTYSSTSGGYDYYNTFQAGAHFKHLRQATTSPNKWELRTLTGETYVYDWSSPSGKLIEVWDTVQNKTVISYLTSGADTGQIDTVTDASGHKRLKFTYSSGRVSSVAYQTVSGGTGTTRVTASYSYTSSNPTTVQIASTTIQSMTYSSGYLTNISDGDSNSIIGVTYASATPGKVVRVTTGGGAIGYEYASSNSECSGGTILFFNTTDTTCSNDSQCGGDLCGGKTGAGGNDGLCYRAARCLQTSSPSENLVTTITPLSGCTGSCAPTAQYSWNTSTLDLKGIKLADNNWTSYSRDGNGMVTLMANGDSDDDPSNSGGVKTWYFYGASEFPGRVTEIRTRSTLREGTFQCDGGVNTSGCKRTLYGWNNTTGLLDSKSDAGYAYTSSNSLTSFSYTTSFSHDSNGRLTQVDGPLSGSDDVTVHAYITSTDVLEDGYPDYVRRYMDASDYLATVFDDYDYFGNAKSTQDPDGTFTCRTWDGNRNVLTDVREAMNGQTSCATSHSSDLVTSYVYNTRLHVTQTTLPLGDCTFETYDSFGRNSATKLRDDCVSTNAGSTKSLTYDHNGLLIKTELLDASNTVTNRVERTYYDSMQVDAIKNPVAPSYARTFVYLSDLPPQTLTFENGLGKNEWVWDSQNRSTTLKRYTDSTNHQDWAFTYPFTNGTTDRTPEKVTDPASKITEIKYDDLGRKSRRYSPDSGYTLYVYNAASQLVTQVDAYGTADQATHTFTYDYLGRKLTEDYDDSIEDCTGGSGNVTEVTYGYDDSPVTCPTGASCTRQGGRLAYVKNKLLCDSTYTDDTLDQETFYAYDDAGRLVQEYIRDDSGRTADQQYAWDKNGHLVEVTSPSGAAMTYTLGGSGNSDTNLITSVARTVSGTPTNLITNVTWAPFGPVTGYTQANTISSNALEASLTWNLAYRPTQIKYATSAVDKTTIDYTEDEKGRITQKLYSNVHSNISDSYIKYDYFDRPICDATMSGTCPTSGANLRTNIMPIGGIGYNSSNDRALFYHQDPAYGDYSYTVNYVSGTDKISSVVQSGSAGTTSYSWNGRGSRLYEDNNNSTRDRRDYTYEGRQRVRTVSGQAFTPQSCSAYSYVATYAYDHKDRLVFRSWQRVGGTESHTFYYYDATDRLVEVKHIPNISDTSTYTIYDFYWLKRRPVAIWATSFPSSTTARYFLHADEANRVLEMYSWPDSGDATLVWAINPDAFGWDRRALGAMYQPLRLNNMLFDDGTLAPKSCVTFPSHMTTYDRPGLLFDLGAVYDPFTEGTLQRLGTFPDESYGLGSHNPQRAVATSLAPRSNYPSTSVSRTGGTPAASPKPCSKSPSMASGSGSSCYSDTIGGAPLWQMGWQGTENYDACACGCCLYKCSLRSGGTETHLHRCYLGTEPCEPGERDFLLTCAMTACTGENECGAGAHCDIYFYAFPVPPQPRYPFLVTGVQSFNGTPPPLPDPNPFHVRDVSLLR